MPRTLTTLAAAFVIAVTAGVLGHDAYCYATFEPSHGILCERDDGSRWRDPSDGCSGGEDPRCRTSDPEPVCADSVVVPEEAQESCGWFVMKLSSPATGPLDGD